MSPTVFTLVIVLVLTSFSVPALAQGRDAAKADALFREGRTLLKRGDYETACPKFEQSYRLDPAAGTGINLGDCFEKQGRVASALLAYQAALVLLSTSDSRVILVKQQVAALEKRVPRLTIKLAAGTPDGTEVKRDGRLLDAETVGTAMVVNPGKHTVVVIAPGRDRRSYHVELDQGDSRELVVEAGDSANTETSPAAVPTTARRRGDDKSGREQSSEDSSQRTLGYVLGSAGIASALLGTYFLVRFNDGKKKNDQPDYNQSAVSNDGYLAAGLLVGGALGAAGGVALVLTAPSADGKREALRAC